MQQNMRPQWREDCIVRALQNSNEYDVLVQISEFDGGMESKELLDWFDNIGSYFDWKEVPKERKLSLLELSWDEQLLLGGNIIKMIEKWGVKEKKKKKRKKEKGNWRKVKDKLKAKYLPWDYEQTLYQRV